MNYNSVLLMLVLMQLQLMQQNKWSAIFYAALTAFSLVIWVSKAMHQAAEAKKLSDMLDKQLEIMKERQEKLRKDN